MQHRRHQQYDIEALEWLEANHQHSSHADDFLLLLNRLLMALVLQQITRNNIIEIQ